MGVLLLPLSSQGTSPEKSFSFYVEQVVARISRQSKSSYVVPTQNNLAVFRKGLELLIEAKESRAATELARVDYRISHLEFSEGSIESSYVVIEPIGDHVQQGFYFFPNQFLGGGRGRDKGSLIVEAPHPLFDEGTPQLGAEVFRAFNAHAAPDITGRAVLAIAGAYRCSSPDLSDCDGKTSVCSGHSESFRVSDMAHTRESFFEVFHEVMSDYWSKALTIQVHGFNAADKDYNFVASDGTLNDRAAGHLSNAFTRGLNRELKKQKFTEQGFSCNSDPEETSLCATTNVQGRFTNDNAGICRLDGEKLKTGNGRFLHVELAREIRLKKDHSGWSAFVHAVESVLEPEQVATSPEGGRSGPERAVTNPKKSVTGPEGAVTGPEEKQKK